MDYGQLISTAWRMTWRYRGLWLVGLFAGSASGSGGTFFNSGGPPGGTEGLGDTMPGMSSSQLREVLAQLPQVLPVVIAVGVIVLVIYLAFWLLSVACQSAVIAGGREAAAGANVTLGRAWSSGMRSFGRLAALDLLWLVLWLVIVVIIAAYAISVLASGGGAGLSVLFGLFSLIALLGIIASVLSVVIAFAQRAIVLDGRGPIDGLSSGFSIARAHLGVSVILWLVGLALSIGGGIALVIGLIIAAIPGLIVGGVLALIVNATGGPGAVPFFIMIGLTVLVAALVGGAALNTLLWHFWTVSYLRLTRPPEPPPARLSS
ncbi:MAG TPA: hypothetical protein VGL99_31205 [Chloroflexota bacterium]